MAALKIYALLFPSVDGSLLMEESSITITRTTNSQPVHTVGNGYAGESPGAAMCEFDVTGAIPKDGFEFDAGKKMATLTPAKLYVLGPGGATLKGECFIISDVTRHGVNQEATYEFRARGPMKLWS